jgi:VWFA-related protein
MSTRRDFLLSGLGAVPLALAQETEDPKFGITVNEVVAPVTVLDKNGRIVNGLESKDFTLYDNNIVQPVRVEVVYVPISMVVAVQSSDRIEPVLGNIKKLGPMLEGLVVGQQGEAAIMAFDHRIRTMTDGFTNDGKLFTEALDKINPGSKTARLVDTVFEATRLLRNRPKDRKRIVLLIAESQDQGSEGRIREALLSAEVNNIIVYTININRAVTKLAGKMDAPKQSAMPAAARGAGLPPGMAQTPQNVDQLTGYGGATTTAIPLIKEAFIQVKGIFLPNPLEVFTQFTGGREFSFLTLKSLEDVVTKLGEEVHSQYTLTYTPTTEVTGMGGWHDIRVTVGKPNLKVRTRPGYWVAARPAGR